MKKILFGLLLFSFVNALSINPVIEYLYEPDSLGLDFKEYQLLTKDKAKINSWWLSPLVKNDNNNNVIIIAGGDAGNMSYLLNHAYSISYNGYNVVLFDYRGFGKSSSFEINQKQLYYNEFTDDLETVISKVKEKWNDKKIGVLALSMGTIITNSYLKTHTLDYIILEGVVSNTRNFTTKVENLKNRKILLPKSSKKYDELFFVNLQNAKNVIIFHGTEDNFSEITELKKIKKINIIEFNGGHLQGFHSLSKNYFGDLYINHITSFFNNK